MGRSFALNSRYKEAQKSIRVDIDAYLCIWRDAIHAFNNVVVSMQNVLFDVPLPIGDRFAASELAPGFDINAQLRSLDQRGIACDTYCERIIHRSAGRAEFRGKID